MLLIPTWVAENGYVPLPWMASYHILGLFILEGWQIDLHPKTSSWPCWSVTLSWSSCYGTMPGTLIASLIGTPTPRRGWTTRGVSSKLWSSLPSAPSTTLTSMLRMRFVCPDLWLTTFHFSPPFFKHTLPHQHPLFNITCSGRGLHYLCHSLGTSWPTCLCLLFHSSFHNGSVTFLYSIMIASTWAALPAQLMGCVNLNHTSLTLPKGSPSLCDCSPKNRTASLVASTTTFITSSLRPSWNK